MAHRNKIQGGASPKQRDVEACPHPQKMSFGTKKEAKEYLTRRRAMPGRNDLCVYRCACNRFHLGHKKPKWQREAA